MSEFTITNDSVTLSVSTKASEIHAFHKNGGREWMWQGDPEFWSGRNPTLFPLVGSTYDKKLHINGKTYAIGNHGFARHSEFTGSKLDDATIEMVLRDSEETLDQYPFHFELKNSYHLSGSTVTITTTVRNTGDMDLPFGLGYHPAFNVPDFDRYVIRCKAKGVEDKVILLDREALEKTIILDQPVYTDYELSDGTEGLSVHAEGYPWVAFWSPRAPFVCIEPWYTHTDLEKVDVPFEKREGIRKLAPGASWASVYSISLL